MSTRSSIEFMNSEEEILNRKIENMRLSNNDMLGDNNTNKEREMRYEEYFFSFFYKIVYY